MSILQIQRKPTVTTTIDARQNNEGQVNNEDVDNKNTEQNNKAHGVVAPDTIHGNTSHTDVDKNKNVEVIIQGPLSAMYTRILNSMYAVESYDVTELTTAVADDNTKVTTIQDSDMPKVAVYVTDVDKLQIGNETVTDSATRVSLALDDVGNTTKVKDSILAIEQNNGIINKHKSDVIKRLALCGVKIVYSPYQLIKAINV